MQKSERHERIRARCSRALADMYHNATPSYPSIDDERESDAFDAWFPSAVEFEIEYINDGGCYGKNYRRTLQNTAEQTSERAREYYVKSQMSAMLAERERCNDLDSREHATSALWENIGDYGRVYQYGRGGRTLAPENLMTSHYNAGIREDTGADLPIGECVEMLRIVESFNRYVAEWCASVPEQWREQWSEMQRDRVDEAEAFADCD